MNRSRRSRKTLVAGVALGLLALDGPARAADVRMPVKAAPVQPVFDWTGFYIGAHAGYGGGSTNAALTDPFLATTQGPSRISGMIGGVQAGYNVRLPSGLLFGVEADLTFPNYLTSNAIVALAGDAGVQRRRATRLCRHRARPSRLRLRSLAALCHRRACLCRRALCQLAADRRRGEASQRPARLGRRRRRRICVRAALERAAGISLQPVRARQRPADVRHAIFVVAGFPVDPRRSQPQDRLAGIAGLLAEDIVERSGIRPLGNPRPDHLSAARLSRASAHPIPAPTA